MIKLEYFHNPVCPYCPAAKTLITKVLQRLKDIQLVEVDTFTDEGIARGMSLNLMAVPAIAINGIVKITGWPFEERDLLACIEEAREK
jgi:glutaredoxin